MITIIVTFLLVIVCFWLGVLVYKMILRDYFAGQTLAGILSDSERSGSYQAYATDAYKYADAMLEARK